MIDPKGVGADRLKTLLTEDEGSLATYREPEWASELDMKKIAALWWLAVLDGRFARSHSGPGACLAELTSYRTQRRARVASSPPESLSR